MAPYTTKMLKDRAVALREMIAQIDRGDPSCISSEPGRDDLVASREDAVQSLAHIQAILEGQDVE